MAEVWGALGTAPVTEAYITAPGFIVDGYVNLATRTITINPAPAIVDTVIHELLHWRYPQWSENYVRRTTSFLRNRMSDAEIQSFYWAYRKRLRSARARRNP